MTHVKEETSWIHLEKENDLLSDVHIRLTGPQYDTFLKNFPRQDFNWQKSSCTCLVQSALAEFRGRHQKATENRLKKHLECIYAITQDYSRLEALVNPTQPSQEHCARLCDEVEQLCEKLREHKFLSEKVEERLCSQLSNFSDEVRKHGFSHISQKRESIKQLFAAQDLSHSVRSLGSLVAQQYMVVLACAIEEFDRIQNAPLREMLMMHPLRKALSNAKSGIEIRESLYGARYVNTHSPIPLSMYQWQQSNDGDQSKQRWLSIGRHVRSLTVSEIDRVLCKVSGKNFSDKKVNDNFKLVLIFFANIFELILIVPIRVAVIAFSCCMSLILRGITFGYRTTSQLDEYAQRMHRNLSFTAHVKRHFLDSYKRTDDVDDHHQEVLSQIQQASESVYADIFAQKWLQGDQLAANFFQTLTAFCYHLAKVVREPLMLLQLLKKQDEDQVYEALIARGKENIAMYQKQAEKMSNGPVFEPIAPWPENKLISPLDFFDEIAKGLSDAVIDKMFRHSPVIATVFFALSMLSFGTVVVPGLADKMGQVGQLLYGIPSWFSKNFTGSAISESLTKKMVGCFLEWKALFFPTELALGFRHQDYDYLRDLFANPEKILIGMSVLIGLGHLLKFIPHIDSQAGVILNFFSDEARNCSNGTAGLTGIEYAFLGLKFSLLLYSMFSDTQLAKIEARPDCQKSKELLSEHSSVFQSQEECLGGDFPIKTSVENMIETVQQNLNTASTSTDLDLIGKTLGQMMGTVQQNLNTASTSTDLDLIRKTLGQMMVLVFLLDFFAVRFPKEHLLKRMIYRSGAQLFYDRLVKLINHYNAQLDSNSKLDVQVFLQSFYNKHCYESSSNIVRLFITFSPLLFLVWGWRGLKAFIASREKYYSPSVLHQVKKSFFKDLALWLQIPAFLSRVIRALTRAINYVVRPIFFLTAWSVGLFLVPVWSMLSWRWQFKSFNDHVFKWTVSIRLHDANLFSRLRPYYARACAMASINSEALADQCRYVLDQLRTPPPKCECKNLGHK